MSAVNYDWAERDLKRITDIQLAQQDATCEMIQNRFSDCKCVCVRHRDKDNAWGGRCEVHAGKLVTVVWLARQHAL